MITGERLEDMVRSWDDIVEYFNTAEDPLQLGGVLDYQVEDCLVRLDETTPKLLLTLEGYSTIYCALPNDSPAKIKLCVRGFQASGLIQSLLRAGGS